MNRTRNWQGTVRANAKLSTVLAAIGDAYEKGRIGPSDLQVLSKKMITSIQGGTNDPRALADMLIGEIKEMAAQETSGTNKVPLTTMAAFAVANRE